MTGVPLEGSSADDRRPWAGTRPAPVRIDTRVAHSARMYDYLLGGSANFAVDRRAVEWAWAAAGGIEVGRAAAGANRAFLRRVLHHVVRDAGVRQFLDIGTGVPRSDGIWSGIRSAVPGARSVFVDTDPVVLAHAHVLVRGAPEGTCAYVDGDLRESEAILEQADRVLDFGRPVAVMLVALLHLIGDEDDPVHIVARLVDAVPPGSYVALSHLTWGDRADAMPEVARRLSTASRDTFFLRDRGRIARLVAGLDVIAPGIVGISRWRPDGPAPAEPVADGPPLLGVVARKG